MSGNRFAYVQTSHQKTEGLQAAVEKLTSLYAISHDGVLFVERDHDSVVIESVSTQMYHGSGLSSMHFVGSKDDIAYAAVVKGSRFVTNQVLGLELILEGVEYRILMPWWHLPLSAPDSLSIAPSPMLSLFEGSSGGMYDVSQLFLQLYGTQEQPRFTDCGNEIYVRYRGPAFFDEPVRNRSDSPSSSLVPHT